MFAMNALPYQIFNASIKAAFCQVSERRAMCMEVMVLGLNPMQPNTPRETSVERNDFSQLSQY